MNTEHAVNVFVAYRSQILQMNLKASRLFCKHLVLSEKTLTCKYL